MDVKFSLILALVAALNPLGLGFLYTEGDDVAILTSANFEKAVVLSEGVSMVEFYAPWCGHCKTMAPHYKTVAQKLKGIMTIGAVDCDDVSNKKLCANQGIKGFPTIKLFSGEKMKNPYTEDLYKEATDFSGPHTLKGLHDAATALLTGVRITRAASLDEFVDFTTNNPERAKVVLFTSKKDTPVMFKGLSMQLHRGLDFAEVHESVEDVVLLHSIETFPSVLVIKADGSTEAYTGDLKAPQLRQFLVAFSSEPQQEEASGSSSDKVKSISLAEAIELDAKEDMWLLALRGAGSDCKDSVGSFVNATAVMQEVVKYVLVNVPTEDADQVSRYGASAAQLRSDPCHLQLVLLPFGEDKASLDDYAVFQGELEGKSLQKWVTSAMPGLPMELTKNSIEHFMAMSIPEGSDRTDKDHGLGVRVVLFTDKNEVPGIFKALAYNYRDFLGTFGLAFGWVQATTSGGKGIMEQLRVTELPSLIMVTLHPTFESGKFAGAQAKSHPYKGPIKYHSMHSWMDNMISTLDQISGGKFRGKKAHQSPEKAMAQLVPAVSSAASLVEHCTSKGGICVLALVDASVEKHEQVKKALAAIATEKDGQPFTFCWINGAKYRSVASAFGLMPTDLPAVVAFSGKRMRYAALPKVSDAQAITSFIDGVLGGSIRTNVLDELPSVVENSEAPAVETEEVVVEEEFDLSDVMSEEVEGGENSKEKKMREIEEQLKAEEEAKAAAAKKANKKKKKKSKKSKAKTEL